MKVICILDVDEDRLRSVSCNEITPYEFDPAFTSEMRWIGTSGIRLEGHVCIPDEEANEVITNIISRYI